jgi:hypothetical protein
MENEYDDYLSEDEEILLLLLLMRRPAQETLKGS